MKKIASLLLTAILLATMLCVFAVPASAAENLTVDAGKEMVLSENAEYNILIVKGILLVEKDVQLTAEQLSIYQSGTILLKPDVKLKIKAKNVNVGGSYKYIPSGVTVEVEDEFGGDAELLLEPGATLKAKNIFCTGKLTVSAGAMLITSYFRDCNIDLYGTLKNPEDTAFTAIDNGTVYNCAGALLDVTCANNAVAQQFTNHIQGNQVIADGTRVYSHNKHVIEKTCVNCGEGADGGTASVLSEGSLTVIVGVACSVVFLAVGFFIGTKKKKKPALVSGENTDEE